MTGEIVSHYRILEKISGEGIYPWTSETEGFGDVFFEQQGRRVVENRGP